MTDLDQLETLARAAICVPGVPDGFLLPLDLDARVAFRDAANPAAILALIAEVRALREESLRLDFVLANDAFTVRCNRDGSILQYQLMTQDEDENYQVLHDEHRFYNTEREAIDAARAKEKA
jgi:hypothetical protein